MPPSDTTSRIEVQLAEFRGRVLETLAGLRRDQERLEKSVTTLSGRVTALQVRVALIAGGSGVLSAAGVNIAMSGNASGSSIPAVIGCVLMVVGWFI